MYTCHFCGAIVENPREVFRSTECTACHKDLKICLNCRFHSPGSHWDCSETIEDQVRDKDRANFCSFFSFRDSAGAAQGGKAADPRQQARRKLDQLFGNEE